VPMTGTYPSMAQSTYNYQYPTSQSWAYNPNWRY
jgi:hypothetical protein